MQATKTLNLKAITQRSRRSRWGKGQVVVYRSPNGRLGVASFSSAERAVDFVRRAALNSVRVLVRH